MPTNVLEMLLGAVIVLGGIVWNNQDKRITTLETRDKERMASDQTLREAVIKLTVTVEHLSAELRATRGAAE